MYKKIKWDEKKKKKREEREREVIIKKSEENREDCETVINRRDRERRGKCKREKGRKRR